MDSSASDSKKEITCTTFFSKLSEKNNYHILVNIMLHVSFITFLVSKFKGKSNSVSVNFLNKVITLVAAAVIQKEH